MSADGQHAPTLIMWGGPDDGARYPTVLLDPFESPPLCWYDNYRLAATSRHMVDNALCSALYVWREVWDE